MSEEKSNLLHHWTASEAVANCEQLAVAVLVLQDRVEELLQKRKVIVGASLNEACLIGADLKKIRESSLSHVLGASMLDGIVTIDVLCEYEDDSYGVVEDIPLSYLRLGDRVDILMGERRMRK